MDLRQRDPFARRFAELIIRFRSIGFLLVLILIGVNGIAKSDLYSSLLGEMSSHLSTIFDFIQHQGFNIQTLTTHWNAPYGILIGLCSLVVFIPLFQRQWVAIPISIGVSAGVVGLVYCIHCGTSQHLSWGVPALGLILGASSKSLKWRYPSYLGALLLGGGLGFIQLGALSHQLGVDQFILSPQWLIILTSISASILSMQVFQSIQVAKDPKVMTPASVLVQWFIRYLPAWGWGFVATLLLVSLSWLPSLNIHPIHSLFFLMATFQMAVLHLVLFPMILNILGVFQAKS